LRSVSRLAPWLLAATAALFAVAGSTDSARAQPADAPAAPDAAAQACVDQHVLGQQLVRKAKLLEARQTLIRCSHPSCPAIVVGDCSQWLREVEPRIPSVVIGATGPDGRDAVAVRTFVDGRLVSERLDGRPIELDPGEHALRFELAGSRPVEERIVIQDGHRGRRVAVRFPPSAAAATAEASRPVPPLVYVLGGLGVVGLAGFATFGIIGLDQRSDLDGLCSPSCTDDELDANGRRSFLIADISLGVGAAALVAATIVYLTRPTARAPASGSANAGARKPGLGIAF
jgi:hypothetical protein